MHSYQRKTILYLLVFITAWLLVKSAILPPDQAGAAAELNSPQTAPAPYFPETVFELQEFLYQQGYTVTIDGKLGPETHGALKEFFADHETEWMNKQYNKHAEKGDKQ